LLEVRDLVVLLAKAGIYKGVAAATAGQQIVTFPASEEIVAVAS
jgi:hypothetical protein